MTNRETTTTTTIPDHANCYTVIAQWHDNDQTIVEHVRANSPDSAIVVARRLIAGRDFHEESRDEAYRMAVDLTTVVDVFEGHHFSVLTHNR